MNKFVTAILAASSLSLIGSSALAMDHHMAGDTTAPTQESCMALHHELMAGIAEDDTAARDAVIAGLDAETRTRVEVCHAMMAAAHQDAATTDLPQETRGPSHVHEADDAARPQE